MARSAGGQRRRGANALAVDMIVTISCGYADADAVLRAHQRAIASGTELRLTVTHRIDSLIPARPREAHGNEAAFTPAPRPAGTGARPAGARKDGTPFPIGARRAPLPTLAKIKGRQGVGDSALPYRASAASLPMALRWRSAWA
jgi:hypothetical protein